MLTGGAAASVLSIAVGESASQPLNGRGTSKNSQTNWFDTTSAHWHVRWLQEGSRMCDLYDWIRCRRLNPLSTVLAHLSRQLHRRLANAKSHVPQLHGTGRCGSIHHLRNVLIVFQPSCYSISCGNYGRRSLSPTLIEEYTDLFLIIR